LSDKPFLEKLYSLPDVLPVFASFHLNLYTGTIVRNYSFLRKKEYSRDNKFFYAGIIMILCEAGALLSFAAVIRGSMFLLAVSCAVVTITLLLVHSVSRVYPELIQNLTVEARIQKYNKSTLENINLEKLKNDLLSLMEKDKIYCDEDLNLGSLAEELGITSHQLSQFLNEKMNRNFNSFVNEYRVKEASSILIDEPERSSISVAMASGFNSVSVFHAVFKKQTGLSPGNFRKKALSEIQK
jgi:YesN/AraC family two-component response regulator